MGKGGLIAAPFGQAVTKLRGRVFEEEIEWESMLRGRILLGGGGEWMFGGICWNWSLVTGPSWGKMEEGEIDFEKLIFVAWIILDNI